MKRKSFNAFSYYEQIKKDPVNKEFFKDCGGVKEGAKNISVNLLTEIMSDYGFLSEIGALEV